MGYTTASIFNYTSIFIYLLVFSFYPTYFVLRGLMSFQNPHHNSIKTFVLSKYVNILFFF